MAFHQRKRKKIIHAAIVVIGAIIFIILLYSTSLGRVLSSQVDFVRYNLFGFVQTINNRSTEKTLLDYKKENIKLELKVADLTYRVSQLEYLKEENQELQKLLNFSVAESYERVGARVIGRDIDLENSYIIDKGGRSGVKVGDAVVAGEGSLIGKIISVGSLHSTVLLANDNQVDFSVSLIGSNKPIGVSQGSFGLSIIVNLIPQNELLEAGDVIVSAGVESNIPYGLPLGTVNRIISNENDLFKQAALLPIVDYQTINVVAVLTSIDE